MSEGRRDIFRPFGRRQRVQRRRDIARLIDGQPEFSLNGLLARRQKVLGGGKRLIGSFQRPVILRDFFNQPVETIEDRLLRFRHVLQAGLAFQIGNRLPGFPGGTRLPAELFDHLAHRCGGRADRPLVTVDARRQVRYRVIQRFRLFPRAGQPLEKRRPRRDRADGDQADRVQHPHKRRSQRPHRAARPQRPNDLGDLRALLQRQLQRALPRRQHHADIVELCRQVSGVVIECLDYGAFIARYDSPGTLFYLDPPYWGCEDDYGKAMFARGDFERLAAQMAGIRGRFLMSINDVPQVRELFGGFEIEAVEVSYTVGRKAGSRGKRGELLVSG